MNGYEVVLLDFDGTICDTREAVVSCMVETIAREGGPIPTRQAACALIAKGLTLGDTLRRLAGTQAGSAIVDPQRLIASYRALYPSLATAKSVLYPGVKPMLEEAARRGIGLAIVSNKGEQAILRTLERFEIDVFSLVAAERPNLRPKPDPAAFTSLVARRFPNVPHDRFLMVGDTPADLGFARNAGIASCWAQYGYGDPEACRAMAPDHAIAAFAELRGVLNTRRRPDNPTTDEPESAPP